MKTENKILLSRFMTRSGDQAWDFAVPLILIEMFPTNMRVAFIYFFTIKFGSVIFMPYVGRLIDKFQRKKSLQYGIALQVFAVLMSSSILFYLDQSTSKLFAINSTNLWAFILLLLMGFLSSVGTNVMDIAVASDLVPSAIRPNRLPFFNSRLRQLDLLTEVTSPILAGLLLMITFKNLHLIGFYLVALWNVMSFYPEYVLLNQILNKHPELNNKKIVSQAAKSGFIEKLKKGWSSFIHQPVSLLVVSYALLWISVLSPHGVLLTAFLKGGWLMPEPLIGSFRALGAVFGLSATFIFPHVHKRFGPVRTGKIFISFQALMVFFSLACFYFGHVSTQWLFLLFILFSRIGLYGFSLSETELRQIHIPEHLRGEINGVASSLTSLATLIIFGLGISFSTKETFGYLVVISTFAVIGAAILYNGLASKKISTQVNKEMH